MQVSDLCTRSLDLAGVTGVGSAPSAEEMDKAVDTLNTMLYAWALDGMDVGHVSDVISTNDLYVDPAYLRAIIYCLAVELSLEFGTELMPGVVVVADDQMDKVRAALCDIDIATCDDALTQPNRIFNHTTG